MSDQDELLFQQTGAAGLVQVWRRASERWLTIDDIEQSRIDCEQGTKLSSAYHQAFLAALLFIETPEKVLLAGVGGGALARYLHAMRPGIIADAIENDRLVADLAVRYFSFPENNWTLMVDDIQNWQGDNYDFIITDIAERAQTPAWLTEKEMLLQFKRQLSDDGVLAINLLVADAETFAGILGTIRDVFQRRTLCLSVPDYRNIIVFAFNSPPAYGSEQLSERSTRLSENWSYDFDPLLAQLKKDNPQGSGVM